MGIALQRAAFSPNIKMRRDFSCAVFDDRGLLLAQAAHIPVHLGAMGLAMEAVLNKMELRPGDVAILNDPFAGGTHLPDISLVSAAYSEAGLLGYVMSRAHHSDVGGSTPASMPLATEIFQEGLVIPPMKLMECGVENTGLMDLITHNVRTPDERRGDLVAQLAAQSTGESRFAEIADRYGIQEVREQAGELMRYSEVMTGALISELPDGEYRGQDVLDDDGFKHEPVAISVKLSVNGSNLEIDLSESANQRLGPVNAVEAVTRAVVLYVIRTLMTEDVPVNAGMLRPITVLTRRGTVVDADMPAAVSAGNVETSQRIVDALFLALSKAAPELVPAASQGTMNNFAFGGFDPFRNKQYTYYETLGGGMGARSGQDGMSGVHDHMSNTLNTPIEALEMEYPVRVVRYELRAGSGGNGKRRGGNGLRREIQFLSPATVSIISERRSTGPYGLFRGEPGRPGVNVLIRSGKEKELPSKVVVDVKQGDTVRIETPGGGGYGTPESRDTEEKEAVPRPRRR